MVHPNLTDGFRKETYRLTEIIECFGRKCINIIIIKKNSAQKRMSKFRFLNKISIFKQNFNF